MDKLKPCPFCGGDAKLHRREMDGLDNIYIQCKECKATSPIFARPCGVIPRREKESSPWFKPVVEAWNRRARNE